MSNSPTQTINLVYSSLGPNQSDTRASKYQKNKWAIFPPMIEREPKLYLFSPYKKLIKTNKSFNPDSFIKITTPYDMKRIETIVHNKKDLTLLKKIDKSYVKLSNDKRFVMNKTKSIQNSPVPLFFYKRTLKKNSENRPFKLMVDASFNTD